MIHLITYGDKKYKKIKERLYIEALNTNQFNTITVYGPEDLDIDFRKRFKSILKKSKGGEYWIWKSYIIKKKLNEINDNDILIYLDAGCTINPKGVKRFYEYIDIINNSEYGIISFQMHQLEKNWTTKEIFNYFNVENYTNITDTGQILSGIIIMKKNNNTIQLNNIWYNVIFNNPLLFTDYYNNKQEKYFRDNRHEQSVFSVIRKMNNSILIHDETYFKPFNSPLSLQYPFWATRKK